MYEHGYFVEKEIYVIYRQQGPDEKNFAQGIT
jgi:hypothetical protein